MRRLSTPLASSTAAAGASTDALLAALEKSDKLVLMLLAALATGQLFKMLELDGEPVVRLTDEGMELDLLEITATEEGGRAGGCKVAISHVLGDQYPALRGATVRNS